MKTKTKRTARSRPKKPPPAPDGDTYLAQLAVLRDTALAFRNDLQRVMGTIAGAGDDEPTESRVHRLRSLVGRGSGTQKSFKRYLEQLYSLKQYLDLIG